MWGNLEQIALHHEDTKITRIDRRVETGLRRDREEPAEFRELAR
jgi:hypothetical protein